MFLIKAIGMVSLLTLVACGPHVVKNDPITSEDYGCKPPPRDVFTQTGVDIQFAQSTFGKVITGDVSVKTDPKVISLVSQAASDDRLRSYLRCLAINRDKYSQAQAAYLEMAYAFAQSKPTADQWLEWRKDKSVPDHRAGGRCGYG
jgi:hypothetical protein